MSQHKVTVLGGGSFGTAVANIAGENGHEVVQWMRDSERAEEINQTRINSRYLPGLQLSEQIFATSDLQVAVEGASIILVAIPAKAFRSVAKEAGKFIQPEQIVVSTTKGIEPSSFKLMSEILQEETRSEHIGVISGPNLAKEIVAKMPSATVIASEDAAVNETIQKVLSCKYLRIYANTDRYGVELGGALKNIFAIISGLTASLGFGENTKSMLITRSLAEMSRLAVKMGANPMTFIGLAGVGDLIVTCMSPLSRNYRVGYALGKGKSLEEAEQELGQVAEGINTLKIVYEKSQELDVYMPLTAGLYHVLFENLPVERALEKLMLGTHSDDVAFVTEGTEA